MTQNATVLDALHAINSGGHGIVFALDDQGRVVGALTDGDLRRVIIGGADLGTRCLETAMRSDFVFVTPGVSRVDVLDLMKARDITQIPILDDDHRLVGLHLIHDLLGTAPRENWAVLMAGGKGMRLRPLTNNVPKPMITVAGRPILERLVLHLVGSGIRRIFISVNYLADVIMDHFGDGKAFGCRIEYLHETIPLHTGGPLSLLPEPPEHSVIVMNGDLITAADIGALLEFHERGEYEATMGVRSYVIQVPYGVADVEGERVIGLLEKPSVTKLINAGIYVLSPSAVELVPAGVEYRITDLFRECLDRGRPVGSFLIEDEWADVGQHHELNKARGDIEP